MLKGARAVFEQVQVVQRVQDLLALAVTAGMFGHILVLVADDDTVHEGFDHHADAWVAGIERHRIGVAVEGHHAFLVNVIDDLHAGFKRLAGQGQQGGSFLRPAFADGLALAVTAVRLLLLAALPQVGVQFGPATRLRARAP